MTARLAVPLAATACSACGGALLPTEAEVVTVTDEELLEWWRATARLEGVFCELASVAGVAGVAQVRPSGRVVCVLTGHGLKDPDAVDRL